MNRYRTPTSGRHGSHRAEIVELATVFLAAGVVHLFVTLVGHHAAGGTALVVGGAALLVGAGVHRWWALRRSANGRAAPTGHEELDAAGADRKMWRVQATLPDRPGSLAALSGKLAALKVNILGIQVHPTQDGVADELLIAAPPDVTVKEVAAAVEAGGGLDVRVAATDAHRLVDLPTHALGLAVRAATDTRLVPAALAELLGDTTVATTATGSGDPRLRKGDGTTVEIRDHTGARLVLSRPGLPFTPSELARAQALVELCARLGPRADAPHPVRCSDSSPDRWRLPGSESIR
jgi:hypothetical protein